MENPARPLIAARLSRLLRDNPYALIAPPNTQRARRSDWKVFLGSCTQSAATRPCPASPAVIAAFIETMSLSTVDRSTRSVATIERYVSTLAHVHAHANLPDPTRTAYVKGAYRQQHARATELTAKAGTRWQHIETTLNTLNTRSLTWDLARQGALLTVGYSTMARRSELVVLTTEMCTSMTTGKALLSST